MLYFKNSVYAAQIEAALSALSASNVLTEAGLGAKAGAGALKAGTAAGKVAAWKIAAIVGAGIIAATGALHVQAGYRQRFAAGVISYRGTTVDVLAGHVVVVAGADLNTANVDAVIRGLHRQDA